MAADVLPEVEYLLGAELLLGDEDLFEKAAGPLAEKERFGASELLGLKDLFGASEFFAENERFGAPELFEPNERLPVAEDGFLAEGLFAEEGFLVLEAALPLFSCLAIILLVYNAKICRLNYFSYIYGSKS